MIHLDIVSVAEMKKTSVDASRAERVGMSVGRHMIGCQAANVNGHWVLKQ